MNQCKPKALICGVGGQDGAYLAKFLLDKGYKVWGTSRDAQMSAFSKLRALGVLEQVELLSMAPTDFRSVLTAISRSDPDEIYFLAAQSSVGLSFEQPVDTIESITLGTLNVLEAMRFLKSKARLYNASSSECFGDLGREAATERTPFRPCSPYAVAKASAYWLVCNYREAYELYACNGILFNHESPLRPERFVTRKIISAACRIYHGSSEKLVLGRLDIERDWGWAPDYVSAMWRMLQQESSDDFIVATGRSYRLEQFVEKSFSKFFLNWQDHVIIDESLFRPNELAWSQGDASKAKRLLGWEAKYDMNDVVDLMIEAEMIDIEQRSAVN
ncbi:GDP-mannose 4,6-dehydratase [Chromobacterium sp. Rain0013]|nr:GDP-mannose 4,6-dehydratase [Chromobacterium sp. Rain0013]